MVEPASDHRRVKHALILDDVQVNQEVLAEALMRACSDLRIERAGTASQARVLLQAHEFDLIFLDLHLPDGRGDALLAELRAHPAWRAHQSFAIAVTAESDPNCARALLAAGFVEVLIKPWRLSAIEQMVERYLGVLCDSTLFDRAQSLRCVGGQLALLPKLRAMFYAELRQILPQLEQSHAVGDATALEQTRHRLAGAAAFSGAKELSRALETLRNDPSNATLAQVRAAAHALLAEAL